LVSIEQRHILRALPADGLEQGDRFEELGFAEAALAFAQGEVGANEMGQAQGTGSA
jgi:hypothetical protein